MNILKKVQKRFDFLTTSYGLLCTVIPKAAVCYFNNKIFISFEYAFHRQEGFNLSISRYGLDIMESYIGNVFWGDNNFIDEKLSQRLENVYALNISSDKKLDEIIEIYADYINGIICKLLEK